MHVATSVEIAALSAVKTAGYFTRAQGWVKEGTEPRPQGCSLWIYCKHSILTSASLHLKSWWGTVPVAEGYRKVHVCRITQGSSKFWKPPEYVGWHESDEVFKLNSCTFGSVNSKASSCVTKNDVTGKYIISAGRGVFFGDSVPMLKTQKQIKHGDKHWCAWL